MDPLVLPRIIVAAAAGDGTRQRANRDLDGEQAGAGATLAALPTLHREAASGHEWVIADPESALEFLLEVRACQPPPGVEWPEGKKLTVHAEVSTASLALKMTRSRDWFLMDGQVRVDEDLVLAMQDQDRLAQGAQGPVPQPPPALDPRQRADQQDHRRTSA